MTLGFDFGLVGGAVRQRPAPWWHAYRAGPGGPLPALVMEGEAGRLHGATRRDASTLDLSALDLAGGFTLYVRGRIDYTLGAAGFPRLVELGTAGTNANRQLVFIYEMDGRVRTASMKDGVQAFNAILSPAAQSPTTPFRVAARFAPGDFAAVLDGGPAATATGGSLPAGLDRLYLRRTESTAQMPGMVERVVLWRGTVDIAQMRAFDA